MPPPLPLNDMAHVLEHGAPAWEALRGRTLLITGGTGFIGRWLVESFLHANSALGLGAEAFVLSRDPQSFLTRHPHLVDAPGLHFIQGDVAGFSLPERLAIDLCIHAAVDSDVRLIAAAPHATLDAIVGGTRHLLDILPQHGSPKVLYLSSGAIYGAQPASLSHLSEEVHLAPDPLAVRSTYAEGKRLAEHLCALATQMGLPCTVARAFTFVGPGLPLDGTYAVGNFIGGARQGKGVHVTGDGTAVRSYLYAADLAVWLWRLLVAGQPGRAYNVGAPDPISIRDLAATVGRFYGCLVHFAKRPQAQTAAQAYVPDVARAKRELGLTPMISLEAALARTEAYLASATPHAAAAVGG